ncbi:peptidylprolyl isomerase [Maricaulis sp. CAU 1757]
MNGFARVLTGGLLVVGLVLGGCTGANEAEPGVVEVVLETEAGVVRAEINLAAAPVTGGAFLDWVDRGAYRADSAGFYRAVSPANDHGTPLITVLQGGVLPVPDEVDGIGHESTEQTGLANVAGTLALARGELGTGSPAYFFVNLTDNPGLDAGGTRNPDGEGFAVFGRVVSGMAVLRAIHAMPVESGDGYTGGQMLAEPVRFAVRRAE